MQPEDPEGANEERAASTGDHAARQILHLIHIEKNIPIFPGKVNHGTAPRGLKPGGIDRCPMHSSPDSYHANPERKCPMQRLIWSLVALMVAALPAISQPPHLRGHMGGPGMPRLDRLELTDTQEKQMKELRLTHQKKMIQIRSTIEQARLDLQAVRDAAAPDRAAVEKAIKAVSELELQA
jgi:hypothetical protein